MTGRFVSRRLLRTLVRAFSWVVIALAAGVRAMLHAGSGRERSAHVGAILVIRLDLLGDVVFSMPAVAALRHTFPSARIVMLTLPYTASVARMDRCVDDVVAVDTNAIRTLRGLLNPATWQEYARVARIIREQRFDLAVSLSGRTASLCAFLSGARRTIGYSREAYPYVLTDALAGGRYQWRMHEVEYGRALALGAGARGGGRVSTLRVPADAIASANERFRAHGISERETVVAVHLGAGNGTAKRWPLRHWSEFIDAVHARTGARCVLVGSTGDASMARAVVQAASAPLASFVGTTDIPDLAAVLGRADLVVSADSGPLHLAAALGRPVIGIYGPTDPAVYGPHHGTGPSLALREDLPCSPCYSAREVAECPLGDPICMRLVTPADVVDAAVRILNPRERPPVH